MPYSGIHLNAHKAEFMRGSDRKVRHLMGNFTISCTATSQRGRKYISYSRNTCIAIPTTARPIKSAAKVSHFWPGSSISLRHVPHNRPQYSTSSRAS